MALQRTCDRCKEGIFGEYVIVRVMSSGQTRKKAPHEECDLCLHCSYSLHPWLTGKPEGVDSREECEECGVKVHPYDWDDHFCDLSEKEDQ